MYKENEGNILLFLAICLDTTKFCKQFKSNENYEHRKDGNPFYIFESKRMEDNICFYAHGIWYPLKELQDATGEVNFVYKNYLHQKYSFSK